MPELEADVRAPELVHGDGELQQLGPARAVVVVQHEGVVLAGRGLPGAEGDEVLAEDRGLQAAPGDCGEGSRPSPRGTCPLPTHTRVTGWAPVRWLHSEAGLPGPRARVGLGDVGEARKDTASVKVESTAESSPPLPGPLRGPGLTQNPFHRGTRAIFPPTHTPGSTPSFGHNENAQERGVRFLCLPMAKRKHLSPKLWQVKGLIGNGFKILDFQNDG